MKLVAFRNFLMIAGLAVLVLLSGSYDARANGRDRDSKRDKKCAKFVNCHDASEGRVDGRGPRRGNDNDDWNGRNNRRNDNDNWRWGHNRRNDNDNWSWRSRHDRDSDRSDNRWRRWNNRDRNDRNRDWRHRDTNMTRNVSWTRRGR